MNTWREFRFLRKGKASLIWMIKQDGESYFTRHGQLDGALQEFSDTPGPKGKEDTKAYVNAFKNCDFHVGREIRKKIEAGYIAYVNDEPTKEQITELYFDRYLPKQFCGYKPQTSITDKVHYKIYKEGNARYTRKLDGMCSLAVYHTWGWEIYSRRMDLLTDRFHNHIEYLSELDCFKHGTMLVGEMICLKSDGKDDFKAVSRVCRSKAPDARKLVEDGEVPEPVFVVFDCLYYNGKDLQDTTYDERAKIWKDNFDPLGMTQSTNFVCGINYFQLTPDNWEEYAKDKGWEGFVVTDGSAKPGDKFYSFNGKAKRPKGSHKLKPLYTEDCAIYAGLTGTGKRLGGIGSVFIKQKHPDTGQWFPCGKAGSGFTDNDLVEIEELITKYNLPIVGKEKELTGEHLNSNDGIVMELEYSDRQPGTNKFRFPVFARLRFDKGVEECEAQRLAPEDE